MYVYIKYYNADKVALVYPGTIEKSISGKYFDEESTGIEDKECSMISLAVDKDITKWQQAINATVSMWL